MAISTLLQKMPSLYCRQIFNLQPAIFKQAFTEGAGFELGLAEITALKAAGKEITLFD